MTSILEKLESDFANMESTMSSEESKNIDYDDVLPVVEKSVPILAHLSFHVSAPIWPLVSRQVCLGGPTVVMCVGGC